MMQAWADYLDVLKPSADVIPLFRRRRDAFPTLGTRAEEDDTPVAIASESCRSNYLHSSCSRLGGLLNFYERPAA